MASAAKAELLAASAAQDIPALVDLFERNSARKDELDLGDVLATLSSKESAKLWEGLEKAAVTATTQLFAEEPEMDAETALALMRGLCALIQTADKNDSNVRAALPCLAALHDMLLELGSVDAQLQIAIARLCEGWWVKEREGAELLIPQLLPFLLLAALEPTARDADVKRLHAVRKALLLLDFNDESIESIRELLLRTVVHPAFLKCVEGTRFLGFLFTIHPDLVPLLHRSIREQLPHAPTGILKAYGELYVRAWKEASVDGTTVQVVEECIQSIMHAAIHAARRPLFAKLRVVLSVIHEQKINPGFDALLLQLYSPILWRSLRCANAVVRAQACTLFFDVFPLQDPNASAEQADALLQRQFDVLAGLLRDQDPRVRIPAVTGVCKMLSVFWESIPLETIKEILGFVVGTLGVDASSAPVRVAVINGVNTLFDNPLAHTVLKPVLPLLANCVHDTNARVRLAFIELLSKLKKVKGIKFYKIVPVEHLLARLKEDAANAGIVKAMTSLLLNSYYPQTGDNAGGEQLRRCLAFLEQDVEAAIVFYSNLHSASSVGSAVKLSVLLLRCLSASVALPAAIDREDVSSPQNSKQERSKRKHTAADDGEDDGVITDPVLRTGMLRVLDCTLRSIAPALNTEIEAPSREMVQQFYSFPVLQELYDAAVDTEEDLPYVLRIAATIGPMLSPHTGKKASAPLLERLMRDSTAWIQLLVEGQAQPRLKTALIHLCCAQGREDMIVDAVCLALTDVVEPSATPGRQKKNAKKAAASERLPAPLAVEVLSVLLRDPSDALVDARERCIVDDQQYHKLQTALANCRTHCERLIWSSSVGDLQFGEAVKNAVMLAWELEMQRVGVLRKAGTDVESTSGLSEMLQWFEERVLSGFVRTSEEDEAPSKVLQEITAAALTVVAEAVLCELIPAADFERLSRWATGLADQSEVLCQLPLFPAVCRLAYQVALKDKAQLATEPLLRLLLQAAIPEAAAGEDDVVSKDARRTLDAVISCCIAPGPKLAPSRKSLFGHCFNFMLEGLGRGRGRDNASLDTICLSDLSWKHDHSCAVAELMSKNFKSCKLVVEDLARYLKRRLGKSNDDAQQHILPIELLDEKELSTLTQLLAAFVRGSSEECQEQLHACLVELSGFVDGMATPKPPTSQKKRATKRGVLQTKNTPQAENEASETPQPKGRRRRRQSQTPEHQPHEVVTSI